jgi:polar amino acid transport system permease protein
VTTDRTSGAAPAASPEEWRPSEYELARRAARRSQNIRRIAVAVASSIVVIGALVLVVVTSSGWPVVRDTFFDVSYGWKVLPAILDGFKLDLLLVVVSTVCIAVLSMLVALVRTSRSAPMAPLRILGTVYVDFFRGTPLILVILLIGFGVPALNLPKVSSLDVAVLGTVAIVLTYTGYVAEVIRSGILSVHPSQRAAARSLGLSHVQTMRHVVLPQGIRRVMPPLLNDFVSLLKDVGLVSILGVYEAIQTAQVETARTFNYTPYVVAALVFLVVTVPMTRLTDRVMARQIARQNAGGTA